MDLCRHESLRHGCCHDRVSLIAELAALRAENERLNALDKISGEANDSLRRDLACAKARITELRQQLAEKEKQIGDFADKLNQSWFEEARRLTVQLADAQTSRDELNTVYIQRREVLEAECAAWRERTVQAEQQLADTIAEREHEKRRADDYGQQLADAVKVRNDAIRENNTHRALLADARAVLDIIEKAIADGDGGSYWPARKYLDDHGVYNDDLNELRVLGAVAKAALAKLEGKP